MTQSDDDGRIPLDDYRRNNNADAPSPSLPERSPGPYELGTADYEAGIAEKDQ